MILNFGFVLIEAIELRCQFTKGTWEVIGVIYRCGSLDQDDIILERNNSEITAISGNHEYLMTNNDVKGVFICFSKVYYFPHGLLKFFPNLEGIDISKSNLKEIIKKDLKDFTNLRHIDVNDNKIEYLEANLFENNPKLEYINASKNKIAYIDPEIFNNFINKLSFLRLNDNICQFETAYGDKKKANQIIAKVQSGFCIDGTKLPQTTTTSVPPVTLQFNDSKNFIIIGIAFSVIVIATILMVQRQKRAKNVIYLKMEEVNMEKREKL